MRILGVLIAATFLVLTPVAASAATPDVPGRHITRWDETYTLQPDGSADVRLEIDFDFGNDPGHGPYLVLPTRQGYDKTYYRLYATSRISASSPTGAPAGVNLDTGRDFISVRIGNPNIGNVSGTQTYVITYSVAHVMNATAAAETSSGISGDEFYWNAMGDGWTVPIAERDGHGRVAGGCDQTPSASRARSSRQPLVTGRDSRARRRRSRRRTSHPGQPLTVDVLYPAGHS